jgi:hypothetical protein
MKKVIAIAIVSVSVSVLFMSCEGPAGKTGAVGPQGATGATGAKGESGATARFYDFQLSWNQSSPMSLGYSYQVPNFQRDKEYVLLFLRGGSNVTFKPLPIKDDRANTSTNESRIVNMEYMYQFDGKILVFELNYRNNTPASYNFRAVVVPMVAGGRLPADVSYESLKKRFNLKD